MKLTGTVIHANSTKRCFFVAGRNEKGLIEKFYSNWSRISLSTIDYKDIKPGDFADWNIDTNEPKKPGGLRVAVDVFITPSTNAGIALAILAGQTPKVGGQ